VTPEKVVVLAGGSGGAKLAEGLQQLLGEGLSVIANTADDVEILGADVSPDPDLVTYWLCGQIDEASGWGLKGDTSTVFDRMVGLGAPDWFHLSDRDFATCLYRRAYVQEGGTRTGAQAQIARALGVRAKVLPMSEQPVRTMVRTTEGSRGLQQFLVAERAEPQIEGVELEGITGAVPSPEALEAIAAAEAIVIGPSNPVISIGPILALPGMREALADARAPIVAVSPFVAGNVLKGPTREFMAAIGRPATATGVASLYAGLLDGMLCDEADPDPPPDDVVTAAAPLLMEGAEGRKRVAERTLDLAGSLIGPQ